MADAHDFVTIDELSKRYETECMELFDLNDMNSALKA
jgi:hypothetical protein